MLVTVACVFVERVDKSFSYQLFIFCCCCNTNSAHSVRTFKPVRFDPVEHKLLTSDKNNDKKFAFITQETVVDYRSVEVTKTCVTFISTRSKQRSTGDKKKPFRCLYRCIFNI